MKAFDGVRQRVNKCNHIVEVVDAEQPFDLYGRWLQLHIVGELLFKNGVQRVHTTHRVPHQHIAVFHHHDVAYQNQWSVLPFGIVQHFEVKQCVLVQNFIEVVGHHEHLGVRIARFNAPFNQHTHIQMIHLCEVHQPALAICSKAD